MKLKDSPVLSTTAKGVNAVSGYVDRLLGVSAMKLKAQADLGKNLKATAGAGHNRYLNLLQHRADQAAEASKQTRIKTGLVVGSAAVANHMISSYNRPAVDYQYSYTDSGMPY